MPQSKYFQKLEDRVPAANGVVFLRGAQINGAQSAVTTVTVQEPHGLVAADLFLYALDRFTVTTDRVFTVDSVTATTVTFTGAAFTFPDEALLVPMGTDTGGNLRADGSFELPNWDGSSVTIYRDIAADVAFTNATVPVDPGGELTFYGDGSTFWLVIIDNGRRPVQVYRDIGAAAAAGPFNFFRQDDPPGSPTLDPVTMWIDTGPTGPDIMYIWMTQGDGSNAWTEIIRGQSV